MPQGIHKPTRRSEKGSPSQKQSSGTASSSRRSPRPIYPAPLSQAERAVIESWKEGLEEKTFRDATDEQRQDAIVQAYLAAKLKLFQFSWEKEMAEAAQSDTSSNTSGRS